MPRDQHATTPDATVPEPETNSDSTSQPAGLAADRLKAYIERIERLEEEKKNLTADTREVYAEAKSSGFDTKTMRKVVALRKLDQSERLEQEALLDTYLRALGEA